MLRTLAEEGVARYGLRGYARKLDLDLGTLRSLRDGRDIQVSKLIRILRAMQIELRTGTARKTQPAPSGFAEGRDTPASGPEATRMGYLPIPFHPACGDYSACAPVAFSREWLAAQALDPENLTFVTAPDDRLGPFMPAGTLCLVDTSLRLVAAQAIWAHLDAGRLRLDLISQPKPGTMVIATPLAATTPRVCSGPELDGLRLLGRVVWYGANAPKPL